MRGTTPRSPSGSAVRPLGWHRGEAPPDDRGHGWRGALVAAAAGTSAGQRDVLLAVGVGLLAVVFHLGSDTDGSPLTEGFGVLVIVAMAGGLALRRRFPIQVCAGVGMLTSLYYLGGNSPAGAVVFLFTLYAAAAFTEQRLDGLIALGFSVFFMTASFVIQGPGLSVVVATDYLLNLFLFLLSWSLGDGTRTRLRLAQELRSRAEQLDALRCSEQAELVAAERRRIARELHDVISHTVSVVAVQSGAAQRVLSDDPAAAQAALAAISSTARDAMVELRRMLRVLRDDGARDPGRGRAGHGHAPAAPVPDLEGLEVLIDTLREAGLPIEVTNGIGNDSESDVDAPLPAGVALTVHRVVREGLTNVLRHAQEVGRVEVVVRRQPDLVVVEVRDDGRPVHAIDGAGAGLLGLRERVALHGGRMTSGARADGRGFALRAEVPLGVGS